MGNWRNAFPSNYLKAADFEQPKLLTISGFKIEDFGGEPKPCVSFEELEQALVLNRVNGDAIEKVAGTPDTDHWPGVKVVAYKSETDFQGRRVDCVRIRAPKPTAAKSKPVQKPAPPRPEEIGDEEVPF